VQALRGWIASAFFVAVPLMVVSVPAAAQLTQEQKVHDFENLVSLFAKTYAPTEWKKTFLGFDVLNAAPWLDRVRASNSDLDFLDICYQYIAAFRDTHTAFYFSSSFLADAGMSVDLYGDRVLIEVIDRLRLPTAKFPFRVGDELVAIDGKPVSEIVASFVPLVSDANDRKRARAAVDLLTYRPQQLIPHAVDLGEASVFQIRQQDGTVTSYSIPWTKTGFPVTQIGPVTSPKVSVRPAQATAAEDVGAELHNLSVPLTPGQAHRMELAARSEAERAAGDEPTVDGAYVGYGSRTPIFAIPENFVVRRGKVSTDNFFTATYEVGGKRIGYLRIPSFAPSSTLLALNELINEVVYFNANTDGLVVDVTRNPGGDGCYANNVLSLLIPTRFTSIGAQIRPTLRYVNYFQSTLESAKSFGADAATIQNYTKNLDAITQAYAENRLSPPLPLCGATLDVDPLRSGSTLISYAKPLIVLADDFSTSAADVFPAIMQDSHRGPIVGMPTAGAGGTVIGSITTGNYSEAFAYTTTSLLTRKSPVSYPGLPATPYIENIGVWPDIYLDYMKQENLLNSGRPYVNDFTGVILGEILKQQ